MVKGNKSIKKEIDKDVMIMDSANVAGLVKLDDDGRMHKDYKLKLKMDHEIFDFKEIRLSADGEQMFIRDSKYSFEYVKWFVKIMRAFYRNSKIDVDDLCYKLSKEKDYPCIITYYDIGMVLAPRVTSD